MRITVIKMTMVMIMILMIMMVKMVASVIAKEIAARSSRSTISWEKQQKE